jgi:hypothetical protein
VNAWPEIETEVASFATVVTYDRAGLGLSDPPSAAPTAQDMADDMAAVLDTLVPVRPVVLVGASLAAFPVQLFGCLWPARVAGTILLDPTPDEMLANLANLQINMKDQLRMSAAAEVGVTPGLELELERSFESAVQVRDAIQRDGLPDAPLVVVAIDRPSSSPLTTRHAAMAQRAPQGRLVWGRGTSHQGFVRENAELIVDLIRDVCLGAARSPRT